MTTCDERGRGVKKRPKSLDVIYGRPLSLSSCLISFCVPDRVCTVYHSSILFIFDPFVNKADYASSCYVSIFIEFMKGPIF